MRRMTAAIMAAGLLVTAGCFGDDGESDDDATAETEAPPETEAPADTEPDVETTAESQPPDETDAPAETEPPAATDAPSETDEPAETDAPDPEPDDLLILPEWGTDTISRVTAELLIEAQTNQLQIDPSEAYVGGTPDLSAPRLGLAGFAATTVATTDVILPSEKLRTIARKTWRLPRVHLIPNGIDAARFARNPDAGRAFRAEHGIDTDEVVIGAVGHLRPVKNLGRLIRAAASAPMPDGVRARVVLVGDGAEREALERVVAECNGRIPVTVTGQQGDLATAY